jgi:cytochrome d ubiquinol oxidase subunit I
VWLSLTGFVVFYSALAVVDGFLLVRTVRRGPEGLGYWPLLEPAPSAPAAAGAAN